MGDQRTKDVQPVEVDSALSDCLQEAQLVLAKQTTDVFFLPATTRLISPLSTGTVKDADLTTAFSLASASNLNPASLAHSLATSLRPTRVGI